MRLARFSAALVAAACICVSANAQTDQTRTRAFVEQVALTASDDDALARWDSDVCVGAVGLAPDQLQTLVDRVSTRAQAIGLRAGRPGCRANVMVIYATDSDAITRQIVDQRRDLLGFNTDDGRITAGRAAMEEFANTPRPIRWWHVSSTGVGSIRPDGYREFQSSGRAQAQAAASGGGGGDASGVGSIGDMQGAQGVRSSGSRTRSETVRNELTYALIVVDARRVAHTPVGAWMDYVALNALAQLDPAANTSGYPTILNLFSVPAPAPSQMTTWDVAYLGALYNARSESSQRQLASISRQMADRVPAQ